MPTTSRNLRRIAIVLAIAVRTIFCGMPPPPGHPEELLVERFADIGGKRQT
jgi:hypothetical protein